MTRRERLAQRIREAGVWGGEHEWGDYYFAGVRDGQRCAHCGFREHPHSDTPAYPCPGPERWSLEVLWQAFLTKCSDFVIGPEIDEIEIEYCLSLDEDSQWYLVRADDLHTALEEAILKEEK